jgi:hypothetical protein
MVEKVNPMSHEIILALEKRVSLIELLGALHYLGQCLAMLLEQMQ